ncbi:hypothetical protein F5883DRAFT_369027, partial [Diaporthe sp. PMI_573]
LPGSIMWLPSRKELFTTLDIDERCYNHPVVVLSPQPLNGKVIFMLLTSLGEKDLVDRYPHNTSARLSYLPIDPSRPHLDNQVILKLSDGSPGLKKRSYIKTQSYYMIRYTCLK